MEQQQQQQDASVVHNSILDPIMRLRQRRRDAAGRDDDESQQQQHQQQHDEEPLNRLIINMTPADRQSVQYLVDFLREDSSHQVRELHLCNFSLRLNTSDGSLDILIDFFANDTNLTKVVLAGCDFGSAEEASRLFAAFHNTNNTTVTDLEIKFIFGLEGGAALGACLSDLFRNSNLQRISCPGGRLQDAGIRAIQPSLQANRHLKELSLLNCALGDGGVRLLVDALVGHATLEILDISSNDITAAGLADITRLLESTLLREIRLGGDSDLFRDEDAVQHFARALSRNQFLKSLKTLKVFSIMPGPAVANILQALERNSSLEQVSFSPARPQRQQIIDQIIASLPRINGLRRLHFVNWHFLLQSDAFVPALQNNTSLEEFLHTHSYYEEDGQEVDADDYPQHADKVMAIMNILARNRSLNRAKALLALQPRTSRPIASKSGIWYKAMAKLGQRCSPGASAIFHIVQTRPALLEQQLRPPSWQAASRLRAAVEQERNAPHENDDNDDNNNRTLTATSGDGRKRARLA